jgi:DGQHR domain-containing protein
VAKQIKRSGKKTGQLSKSLSVPALKVVQGAFTFYVFVLKASVLWPLVSINRREEDEDRGYQRVLSTARTAAVAEHIRAGNPIPNSVLVAFDKATFNQSKSTLTIPSGKDVGWVIDGQHRIAGAHEALPEVDIELCVFAFVGVDVAFQIEQFVTINSEAKGVPTSLVYDLISYLPSKVSPNDIARERAIEIAKAVRKTPGTALQNRIVTTSSPKNGQVSLTNFVRKVQPLVHPERGRLKTYSLLEQEKIISNYFDAIKRVFKEQWLRSDNVILKTVGFGAVMNVFEDVFDFTVSEQGGFAPTDIAQTLAAATNFDFEQWKSYGTGNKAETDAAQDFRTHLLRVRTKNPPSKGLRLE